MKVDREKHFKIDLDWPETQNLLTILQCVIEPEKYEVRNAFKDDIKQFAKNLQYQINLSDSD